MASTILTRRTYDVVEAAAILGISLRTARDEIRRTGSLAGVPVIRVTPRRLVIPKDQLDQILSAEAEVSNGAA